MSADRDPRALALAYLHSHQVMTLATAAGDDRWAAAVFYAAEEFTLYFLSAPQTRHARHLAQDPRVAGTIQEDYRDWPAIKGIQFEGVATLLTAEESAAGQAHYRRRYPFLDQADTPLQQALLRVNWYRLQPVRLYFIDNSVRLGHRDEIAL